MVGAQRGVVVGLVALLVLAPVWGTGAGATAAEEPRPKLTETQKQEVRDRYDKATRFYYLRKYPEAILEYEAIYLLSADPVMLYNIAQCHRQADNPEQAAQFYKNYLRNAPTATNRADVEKKIVEMERLAEDRRKLAQPATPTAPATAPPPASVQPPPIAPGTPSVGPPPADLGLPPPPPVPAPDPSTATGTPELTAAPPEPPSRVLPITLMVGGGVFLATSVVMGAVATSRAREVESASQTKLRAFDSDLQKTEQSGKAASNLAVATGLIGAAALGTGIYLWISGRKKAEVARGAEVAPVAGPGYAGVWTRVTF
jgi:hypothetical protein